MIFEEKETRHSGAVTFFYIACLAIILLIAFAVRWIGITDLNYWFDETFSLRMSQFSLSEMVVRCTRDTHPPFFFLLLKGWTSLFGYLELETRLFSLLWSLGAVVAAFGFTYEALRASSYSRARALFASSIAATFLALSPLQIAWAQQVRMYAPVSCFSILSTWMLWRALHSPESKTRWSLFGIIEIMGLYTHVTMLFIFAGHVLAIGTLAIQARQSWPESKLRTTRSFLSFIIVGLVALPWTLIVRLQHSRVHDDFWVKPLSLDLLGEEFVRCFTVYQRPVEDPLLGLWIAQGLIVALAIVIVGRKPFDLLVALTAVSPFVFLMIVSLIDVNIVNARYFIAGHSMLSVVFGVAIARLPSWFLRLPVALLLIATMGYLTADYHDWREGASDGEGIPGLLQTWEEHRVDGEPLLFCNPMFHTTARFYTEETTQLKTFRSQDSYYPFFIGTAIMSEEEYFNKEDLDASPLRTVWVCDFGGRQRYLQPVVLSDSWKLVTETSMRDYSGTFFLRRYDR